MKRIKIGSYDELENLSITELEKNYFKKAQYKNYTYYFVRTIGYYGICLIVVANDKVIYIDEELHYNNLTKNQLVTKLTAKATKELYTEHELMEDITDYMDYWHKLNYLNNYYQKQCESVSIYHDHTQAEKENWHYANFISFCYYKEEKDYNKLCELFDHIEQQHHEKLNEENYFRNAIAYELSNCEYIYGGYDSLYRALGSLGLTPKTLTKEQERITQEEINKIEKIYY